MLYESLGVKGTSFLCVIVVGTSQVSESEERVKRREVRELIL